MTLENWEDGRINKQRNLAMLWKIVAESDVYARQMIVVLGPPEFKDNAYLRWQPRAGSTNPPDQWLYLTKTRKTRRLATREQDPTWGLIGEDLQLLQWPAAAMKLLASRFDQGLSLYDVELIPNDGKSNYGKIVATFERSAGWDSCVHVRSEFFDREGLPVKEIATTWTVKDEQRLRETLIVTNKLPKTKVTYRFVDTRLDVPIDDQAFTPRALPMASRYFDDLSGKSNK